MEHFTLTIKNFEETPIINSFGRTIILNEFHVPIGYKAIDFGIELSIKDSAGDCTLFHATANETRDKHISDLVNTKVIQCVSPKGLAVRVIKPINFTLTELEMSILYQL